MRKEIIAAAFVFCAGFVAYGQIDYGKQYQNGKDFFRQGQYNLAMETFKPLVAYDQKNPYSPYASYYYALAAYKQGYKAVAKDMLLQIRSVHSTWDKIDEVNLWLATIYLEDGDYFQGIKVLNALKNKAVREHGEGVKAQYISTIKDVETLKMMHEEYPQDVVVAKALARELSNAPVDEEDRQLLESIVERFSFERSDFIPEAPETVYKDRYAVSLLLPFMLESLDASPGKKRNQVVLDFYEGIKLAVDSLNRQGPQISLRSYDTDKGLAHLRRLLQTDELKNSDLVIGQLYPEENAIVQQFSLENQVNVVNPFSSNSDVIGENPYAFLFQPSAETIGKKAGEYVGAHAPRSFCMVFYGSSKKDSVLAANFLQRATEMGVQVVASRRVLRDEAAEIIDILATPTEYDEFKYPIQFTLAKDSIGSIFVGTDDPLIYTKVISAVETRGDSILVVGSEHWIDDTAVAFEKYQTLGVVFSAPDFVAPDNPRRQTFIRDYISTYGRVPSNVSLAGYEMMLFFGHQLKTNGVYFQDALNKAEFIEGHLFQGFRYQYSHDNQIVPFVKFKNGVLTLIETR